MPDEFIDEREVLRKVVQHQNEIFQELSKLQYFISEDWKNEVMEKMKKNWLNDRKK